MKKTNDAINNANLIVGSNSEYANLNESKKKKYIKKIEDFIMNRIDYILRFPRLDIPLKFYHGVAKSEF